MIDERHEIIKFASHIPVKFFIHKLGIVGKHWHKSIELLLVLDGQVDITIDTETFHLQSEDIILINSNSFHELHSQSAVMIAIQLNPSIFSILEDNTDNLIFDCNTAKSKNQELFNGIRYAIAQMVNQNTYRNDGTDYKNLSLSYYLISELLAHFRAQEAEALYIKKKYMVRLTSIADYISEHYKENFSLSDLADAQQLSVPYLSSFFNKYMGIRFSQYYTNVKLEHAVEELLNTDSPIESIALNHGFTEVHSFVRSFKKKYGMLPSVYRRQNQETASKDIFQGNLNYQLIEPSNYLHLLTKYLPSGNPLREQTPTRHSLLKVSPVSVNQPIRELHHTFRKFTSVGRASDLLDADIQEMLRDLQLNIGYEYIKFHGILSDDMMVCTRTNGVLRFQYTLVDRALDFLLSINLKPLIQFSFMPMALASQPEKNIFHLAFNTSFPSDMAEWNMLIRDFTSHLLSRYGKKEVISWLFCVWNEPMTSTAMFGFGDLAPFFQLYQNTYRTVKSVCPEIVFGSTSIYYVESLGSKWIENYLRFADTNECRPDFLNIHYYSDILPNETNFYLGQANISHFPKQTDDFGLYIGSIKKMFKDFGYGNLPIYLTEWNFTLSHRNLLNDTCFKSCYIMKNLLKNYDRLDSFGYWSLTDYIKEHPLPDSLFHGGLGIYTINGIRKNVFYTFYFAAMLGDICLASDDGYFITRKENSYQIITYNYLHYGDLFASGELFDITETSRYSAFNMSQYQEFSFELTDLPKGRYAIREYFINRHHGSAYDLWVSFGGIPLENRDAQILKNQCVPGFHSEYRMVEQGSLTYQTLLEPLEIRLTEIKLISEQI